MLVMVGRGTAFALGGSISAWSAVTGQVVQVPCHQLRQVHGFFESGFWLFSRES